MPNRKIFVLDTNILLYDPQAIFKFGDNDIVIPLQVIEELNHEMRRQDDIGRNALQAAKFIDRFRLNGKLHQGVKLPGGGTIKVELNTMQYGKSEGDILSVALSYKKQCKDTTVILVTKDIYLRIKADISGINAEDYTYYEIKTDDLYTGEVTLHVSPETINQFYSNSSVPKPDENLYPNQFVSMLSNTLDKQSALGIFDYQKNSILPLLFANSDMWGIKAKTKEQRFAENVLLNDNIKLATLVGQASTGKTLLALAAGLEKVMEEECYRKLLITTPVLEGGNLIGYQQVEQSKYLRPWATSIYGNLEYIFGIGKDSKKDRFDHEKPKTNNLDTVIHYFKDRGQLEIAPLTHIEGMTMPRQYIIIDDAQNLTPREIKTILGRTGEGTKVVLTGDLTRIDNPYLDFNSNGLTYVIENYKNATFSGHITLTKGERSVLAQYTIDLPEPQKLIQW